MFEWFTWSTLFYLLGLILAGCLTLVASKYKSLLVEIKDVANTLEVSLEDGKLSNKERKLLMKEILDVLKAVIGLKWKIF